MKHKWVAVDAGWRLVMVKGGDGYGGRYSLVVVGGDLSCGDNKWEGGGSTAGGVGNDLRG